MILTQVGAVKLCKNQSFYFGGRGGGSFGGIDSGWVRVMSWALQLGTSFLFFVVVVVTVVILILLIDNSDEEDEEDADDNGIDDDCDDHE